MANHKKPQRVSAEMKELQVLASELSTRRSYMNQLGKSYNGVRDLYEALGYPRDLVYMDYFNRYDRQDIASRIIDAPVNGCWSAMPQVMETEDKTDTQFEKDFIELAKKIKLFHKLVRLDKLCGIGQYAVLFLGFDGVKASELDQPLDGNAKLLYVTPYSEDCASITETETDPGSERYGLPKMYQLKMLSSSNSRDSTTTVKVHFSRILHICEGNLTDDVYGLPRLKKVFNRLADIEKIVGGSGEMYWQGAFPGMALKADADANLPIAGSPEASALTDSIDNYVHKLKRYMKLQGIDVQQLTPQIADPSQHLDVQLQMISAATSIPKRILLGSERGELASGQDDTNWNDVLTQRRSEFCDQVILRPLIDKMIQAGVLSEPGAEGYNVNWPPLYARTDKEKADIAAKRAEALSKYISGGLDMLMTFEAYLEHVCEFDQDVVQMIIASGDLIEQDTGDEEDDLDLDLEEE